MTVRNLRVAFRESLAPPPILTLDQWSDKYRILPSEGSSEAGRWRTSRFPFLREIMQVLSPQDTCSTVVVMKGSQLGFTELALNWMFYVIDYKPCPMLYVQKTLEAVERVSVQRFTPAVDACNRIKSKLIPERSRDNNNTKRIKKFPGGIIMFGGANSAASLRSIPIQYLTLDEEDSYELGIEEEGSPSDLAIRRQANFPRRKTYRVSTPKIKETSVIEPAFIAGDQRRYRVPCPFCKNLDWIRWENIRYGKEAGDPKDRPSVVKLYCEHCGGLIDESYKTWMFDPKNGACWVKENPEGLYPSFHISALYSPLGFFSWKEAVLMWLKANKEFNKELLKVFINTVLGETWSESGKSVEPNSLEIRKEPYPCDVPKGVMLLSAGVDVHEDRIECEIVGWGKHLENWSIDYAAFRGDPEHTFIWQQLDDYLARQWKHESGRMITPAIVAIDSGHKAKVVYSYCKIREFMRYFPIKGKDGWGQGLLNRPNKRNQEGVYLFIAYVDEIKSKIYSQLKVEKVGPGYCHFPDKPCYDSAYFKMLTAERLITKRIRGHNTLAWECPAGKRNEALDCRAYAMVALNILNPNFDAIELRGGLLTFNNAPIKKKKRRIISRGVQT